MKLIIDIHDIPRNDHERWVLVHGTPLNEQEPETGKWIEESTYMECPNCHDIWHYEENQTERFKFCPTCGSEVEK